MEFSLRFARNISSVFSNTSYRDAIYLTNNLYLDSNNVFRRSLVIEVNNDELEIPVIARVPFENLVLHNTYNSTIKEIKRVILPLYNNAPNIGKRTFDSIIAQLFSVSYGDRLQKITTNKGEVYYGGKGIIFDENYTPLLLCTLAARNICTEDRGNIIVYYRPICHVNPKVFLEPNNLINRGIIKKLIPYYTNRYVDFPVEGTQFSKMDPDDRKVKVIVDNFDKFFIEPIKPSPSTCSNDALNECLIDNIDDIMMLI